MTSKNPQSNAIYERMHQTVGHVPRTLLYSNPPRTVANAADLIDQALSTTMKIKNITEILTRYPCAGIEQQPVHLVTPMQKVVTKMSLVLNPMCLVVVEPCSAFVWCLHQALENLIMSYCTKVLNSLTNDVSTGTIGYHSLPGQTMLHFLMDFIDQN